MSMSADEDRDVEEIDVDVVEDDEVPGEGELDPADDYVEGDS
jgi:hypothetical protein